MPLHHLAVCGTASEAFRGLGSVPPSTILAAKPVPQLAPSNYRLSPNGGVEVVAAHRCLNLAEARISPLCR